MIKAQPGLMQGNGFYPVLWTLVAECSRGNYRVCQGTYLEVGEQQEAGPRSQ